ncbi:hypothetical protein VTU32_08230 [Thermoanaerobacter sp. CM-CNRG TB177]|uniref:5' nucleotidase, NT5C type n=1 Tax=Thermoanaerobacter sp. CM-CNRG TB177 TaxID=2800659 RepID=UPI001BDF3A8C|nr:hypothetical protein [Thermoanaerobacter sp. CM-CNRG TB177]MBT1280259.1 hypothetical protein [Thermoanaerobacter sp. CM-CNRG TB177]
MKDLIYFSGKVKDLNRFIQLLYTSTSKIVAVDIDNTLIDTNREIQRLGYDISVYPNPELTADFWNTIEGINILFNAEPIKHTIKILLSFIGFGAEIVLVTSREQSLELLTRDWVSKFLPGFEVYFLKDKHQLDADIYFEDDPYQIEKIISLNKYVMVPRWPYNKGLFEGFRNVIYYDI